MGWLPYLLLLFLLDAIHRTFLFRFCFVFLLKNSENVWKEFGTYIRSKCPTKVRLDHVSVIVWLCIDVKIEKIRMFCGMFFDYFIFGLGVEQLLLLLFFFVLVYVIWQNKFQKETVAAGRYILHVFFFTFTTDSSFWLHMRYFNRKIW